MVSPSRKHLRATMVAGAAALVVGGLATPAAADAPSATISGTAGENVSTTDGYDGRHLRYVGDPAPDGYSDFYQWGSPYVLTSSPEDGPVTMAGTLDVSGMSAAGQVAVIGLHDADALRAGDRGEKAEVGIYVAFDGEEYTVGVTDGDAGGGEFVQSSTTFSADDLTDGPLQVTFVVDGEADPATCANGPTEVLDEDTGQVVATADGCMRLTVNGVTLSDSYGTIVPTDIVIETELGGGAHPGWYTAYGTGDGPDVGVDFDLVVSPIVLTEPRDAGDCKKGGYADFGFTNQGQCIASVRSNGRPHR
jgi:hypothetical protein